MARNRSGKTDAEYSSRTAQKRADRQVVLVFGVMITVGGGLPTALGVGALLSSENLTGSFWTAMTISASTLAFGIGTLVYRWYLGRKK